MTNDGTCHDCTPAHPMNLCPECPHQTTTDEGMAHHITTAHGHEVTPDNWWSD